jgi:hypothetical protein
MADARSIFLSKFKPFISTLKNTSFDKDNQVYLCNDMVQKVYDFDAIIKKLYPLKQPASYDALIIDNQNIYCIEFKNQKSKIIKKDTKQIHKKLLNGYEALKEIFHTYNIGMKEYQFIYCVAYQNNKDKWRRGIERNKIQFGLEEYKGQYFDKIYTNDINFFTHEYKKYFYKELKC